MNVIQRTGLSTVVQRSRVRTLLRGASKGKIVMKSIRGLGLTAFLSVNVLAITPVAADTFTFTTGSPDGRMGTASRPDSPDKIEIESADDFVTTSTTRIN